MVKRCRVKIGGEHGICGGALLIDGWGCSSCPDCDERGEADAHREPHDYDCEWLTDVGPCNCGL